MGKKKFLKKIFFLIFYGLGRFKSPKKTIKIYVFDPKKIELARTLFWALESAQTVKNKN